MPLHRAPCECCPVQALRSLKKTRLELGVLAEQLAQARDGGPRHELGPCTVALRRMRGAWRLCAPFMGCKAAQSKVLWVPVAQFMHALVPCWGRLPN